MNSNKIKKLYTKTDFEASWVSECPWTNDLCLGGEDGRLFFESAKRPEIVDGVTVSMTRAPRLSFPIATDTINGVAFAGDLFAASSRNEVVLGVRKGPGVSGLDWYNPP